MKRTLFFNILLMCFLSVFAQDSYMKLVEKAEKTIDKGEYLEGARLLLQAMKLEPDNAGNVMLLSNVGMLYHYCGLDSMAIVTMNQVAEMAPESVTINSNRARVLEETGMLDEAFDAYGRVLALDSTLVEPRISRGIILLRSGDVMAAEQEIAGLSPDLKDSRYMGLMALLAEARADYQKAIVYYTRLLDAEKSADIYAARAMCHVRLENLTDASEDIQNAIELDADCAEAYVARACMKRRSFLNDESLNDAQHAIDLGADRNRVRALLNM